VFRDTPRRTVICDPSALTRRKKAAHELGLGGFIMSGPQLEGRVLVHVDHERYESATPTTGSALYWLAGVPAGRALFREVDGKREYEPVHRDDAVVHLRNDEHFHSVLDFDIIVNTRKKVVTKPKLSFDEVVHLAYDSVPAGPNILFTITYRHGPRQNAEGELLAGQTVRLKNGMVFSVQYTDRS
jgi:Multiubiquitin